jgi:hypothetical protein
VKLQRPKTILNISLLTCLCHCMYRLQRKSLFINIRVRIVSAKTIVNYTGWKKNYGNHVLINMKLTKQNYSNVICIKNPTKKVLLIGQADTILSRKNRIDALQEKHTNIFMSSSAKVSFLKNNLTTLH